MKKITKQAIRTMTLLALMLSLVLAVSAPCGYLIMAYEHKHAVLETEAEAAAAFISEIISSNPDYWRYEQPRLEDFLTRRPFDNHDELRRIVDRNNVVLAQNTDVVAPPLVTRSHPLYDSGRVVARIEISRSLRPILIKTLGFALFGVVFGMGSFYVLRVYPLRALDEALQSLQESEATFRAMASTAADAIMVIDDTGRITYWNDAAHAMFGFSDDEARGRELHSLIASPELLEPYQRGFDRFTRTGEGPAINDTLEFTARRKDGTRIPIEVSTSAVKLKGAWHAVGIIRDITARKKMESELVKLEKLESLGVLAGGIAHDFNNLLTAVLGNISLARYGAGGPDAPKKRLEDAEKAVHRARDLTRQLLTFSKGGAPVKKASSIREIVEEACRFSLSGSTVKCSSSYDAGLRLADIDSGQISQVMHNIILNAVQAMPGGGTIDVTCGNAEVKPGDPLPLPAGPYIAISVKDLGGGIPPEILPNIFDPFFTTKPKGSGLGLATSYSIIKKHGGYLGVESEPGNGSLFHIYLPASRQEPQEPSGSKQVPISGKGRILVMDDEELVRKVAGEMLQALGYDPVFARDGVEALDRYRQASQSGSAFDAVIMDLTIPGGMGGKEAVQRLRALDPRARVIAASGYSDDPVMAEYQEGYGFAGAITKPFSLETLGTTLRDVLA